MNDRHYRFEDDLEENIKIYESLEKDFSEIKEANHGFINKKITSVWKKCEGNYPRFSLILERLVLNKIIDKKMELIINKLSSKFNPVKRWNDLNSEEKIERVREVSNKRENELRKALLNMQRIAFILGFILFIIILSWGFDGSYCPPWDNCY